MKSTIIVAACLSALFFTACQPAEDLDKRQAWNSWIVDTYTNDAVQNAVIRQHTLYPYHFHTDSAELTDLGYRDLAMLAEHFQKYHGPLNLYKGKTSDKLYAMRVERIKRLLVEKARIDPRRIEIKNDMPGGDGMAGIRVAEILDNARKNDLGEGAADKMEFKTGSGSSGS